MKNISFRSGLTLLTVTILVLSMVVSYSGSQYFVRAELSQLMRGQARNNLDYVAESIEAQIRDKVSFISSMPLNLSNVAEVQKNSGFFRLGKVMYGSVFIPDPDADVTAGKPPTFLRTSDSLTRKYLNLGTTTNSFNIGMPVKEGERYIMTISQPSLDSSGGVDVFEIDVSKLIESVIAISGEGTIGLGIVDSEGQTLHQSTRPVHFTIVNKSISVAGNSWEIIGYIDEG